MVTGEADGYGAFLTFETRLAEIRTIIGRFAALRGYGRHVGELYAVTLA